MPNRVPVNISRWARTDWWRRTPSVDELILLHHELHQLDKFAQVMYLYPFGKDTMAKTIKELITRKDREFFLARLQSSNEIVGWVRSALISRERKWKTGPTMKQDWNGRKCVRTYLNCGNSIALAKKQRLGHDQAGFIQFAGQISSSRSLHY